MAYDEGLVERIRELISGFDNVSEKKMFGGLTFLINGNMSIGVLGEKLVVRMDKGEKFEQELKKAHVSPMDFTHRPMKGFLYVEPEGYSEDKDLWYWVKLSTDYAKSLPPK